MPKVSGFPWQRALAEFMVIFAGITLSLAADDWWQGRIDAQREISVLEGIRSDLQADSVAMDSTILRSGAWDRASLWVQRHWGRSGIPEDLVADSLFPLFRVYRYQPVRSTYVSLLSSGDLDLIRGEGLRNRIVDYYERRQAYITDLFEGSRDFQDKFLVASRNLMLWVQSNPDATSIRERGAPPQFQFLQPWATGSEDPEFRFATTTLGTAGENVVWHFSEALSGNSDLREAITEYLRDEII
jgi:hypothetical protein